MTKKWLHWLNIALMAMIGTALALAGLLVWLRPSEIVPKVPEKVQQQLPPHAFEQPSEAYEHLNEDLLKVKTEPPAVQLPNLRNVLTYYGKNGRPDTDPQKPLMHFSVGVGKETTAAKAGEPLYLIYDRSTTPSKYIFSPNNAPTPLWIEATPQGNQASVEVFLRNEQGTVVRKPRANAQFTVAEKEYARYGGMAWELDNKWRVDGTLLVRQKARWYGPDRFLEHHGGEEYAHVQGKQRIDFGEGDDVYFVFVDESSCLIWKDGRWQTAAPGVATLPYPLMCVRKIDPRLINLELWDVNGRSKYAINILKTTDVPPPKGVSQAIKFLGTRTLSQFLFEVNGKRIVLTPHEWLIFKDNQWQALRDPREIQRYIERKLVAPLFIFDEISRKEDRQVLLGSLYNASRTEALPVEIPLLSSKTTAPPKKSRGRATTNQSSTASPASSTGSTTGTAPSTPVQRAAQGVSQATLPVKKVDKDAVDEDDEDSEE